MRVVDSRGVYDYRLAMLRAGLYIFGASAVVSLLFIWYDVQFGFERLDIAAPTFVIYSWPFYLSGIGGALLASLAITLILGDKVVTLLRSRGVLKRTNGSINPSIMEMK